MRTAKEKSRNGSNRAVRIIYGKRLLSFAGIASSEGLTTDQVYGWWKRHGRPSRITREDLAGLRNGKGSTRVYTLEPDGTKHSGRELSLMFGLSHSAVSTRRIRTGQTVFSRGELEQMAARHADAQRAFSKNTQKRPLNIHDVEYNPTAMERAIMGIR